MSSCGEEPLRLKNSLDYRTIVTPFRSMHRLARDVWVNLQITPKRRQRWAQWLASRIRASDAGEPGKRAVRIDRWFRWGLGGSGARFVATEAIDTETSCGTFWVKWCPEADPHEFEISSLRMRRWRELHPQLANRVPHVVDYSPDERLLVMERRPGKPLSRLWWECVENQHRAADLATCVTKVGEWLREFSRGQTRYGPAIVPLIGEHGRLNDDHQLRVNGRRQIECRLQQADKAVHQLVNGGLTIAKRWSDRFDLGAITASFSTDEPGGFMHGDMKPDNVLIDGDQFSVIDWWAAPCVGWPLPDAAVFAAAITALAPAPLRDTLRSCFLTAYLSEDNDERTMQAIDLIGTIWILRMAAEALTRPFIPKSLTYRQRERLVRRVVLQSTVTEHRNVA